MLEKSQLPPNAYGVRSMYLHSECIIKHKRYGLFGGINTCHQVYRVLWFNIESSLVAKRRRIRCSVKTPCTRTTEQTLCLQFKRTIQIATTIGAFRYAADHKLIIPVWISRKTKLHEHTASRHRTYANKPPPRTHGDPFRQTFFFVTSGEPYHDRCGIRLVSV